MTQTRAAEESNASEETHAARGFKSGWRGVARSARRRAKFTAGLCVVVIFYAVAVFADFLAPYDYRAQSRREPSAPPSAIHFRDTKGNWHARPFVHARRMTDPLNRVYAEDATRGAYPLAFFTRGYTYKLFGLVTTDRHLFGVSDPRATSARADERTGATTNAAGTTPESSATVSQTFPRAAGSSSSSPPAVTSSTSFSSSDVPRVALLGTDALGRDRLSRLLVASRFSLVVGPLGTLLGCLFGVFVGCVAGYAGRTTDALLMRAADTMLALPALVIILAARAAFPLELPPARAALLLVAIFALVGWAEMARVTRGLVAALRRREFVLAARTLGLSEARVLFRHVLPNAARPLVVQATLMLPAFLLAEASLSFLGVGLQEPEPSWGNMLAAASDITLLQSSSAFLLLIPAFAIFLFVLGVRLVGDGMKGK